MRDGSGSREALHDYIVRITRLEWHLPVDAEGPDGQGGRLETIDLRPVNSSHASFVAFGRVGEREAAVVVSEASPIKLGWRLEYAAYRVVEAVMGVLPGGWVSACGAALGTLARLMSAGRRMTVRRNLRIAFAGEMTLAEIDRLVAEVFRRAGSNLLSASRTAHIGERKLKAAIEIEGQEEFRRLVAEGRGVVVILAHMGNWEALAQVMPQLFHDQRQAGTVYRPLNNPLMNARVEEARRRHGLRLFSKRDTPLAMISFLKSGGGLGILSDQRAGNAGELVPFFGRLTSCTPLPALFARRAGAAVVGLSVKTLGSGRWKIKLHTSSEDITDTAACMRLLEVMMRESPADVFWLQERWRPGRKAPLKPEGKVPRAGLAVGAKPCRVLVVGDIPDSEMPEVWDGWARWERFAGEIGACPKALSAKLAAVDECDVLPLECVLTAVPNPVLKKACKRLGLPLIDRKGGRV